MKKHFIALFSFLLVLTLPLGAQEKTPKGEFHVGYSYLRGDFGQRHGDLKGGAQVEIVGNPNRILGLVGNFSTHHGEARGANVDQQQFLFGPRVNLRTRAVTPFVHALFGFHRTRVGFPLTGQAGADDKGFSFAPGAGLDANFHEKVAWRVIQADYVSSKLKLPTGVDQFMDNMRLSSGLVFRWGGR